MKPDVAVVALDQLVSQADLFADCGNSCCKILDPATQTLQRLNDDQLGSWFAEHVMPDTHIVALPGNQQRTALLRQAADKHQARFTLLPDSVSLPACGQYPGMGLDRLCAGIAAIHALQRDVIVIDAGTMLTMSAWRHDPLSDFNCRFVAGYIAPGPQACLDAMHQAAPALPQLTLSDTSPARGSDTASHMQAAIHHGWPAMATALLQHLQRELPAAILASCGGHHRLLPCTTDHHDPALVLHGMQLLNAGPT